MYVPVSLPSSKSAGAFCPSVCAAFVVHRCCRFPVLLSVVYRKKGRRLPIVFRLVELSSNEEIRLAGEKWMAWDVIHGPEVCSRSA